MKIRDQRSLADVEVGSFDGLESLTTLDLHNSPPLGWVVDKAAFDGLYKLTKLDLGSDCQDSCGVEAIEAGAFDGLVNLEVLVLSGSGNIDLEVL